MNVKDLPEIPTPLTVERRVAEISYELAEALGLIECTLCERYYAPEQMAKPGSCFRKGVDVYRIWPTCKVCAEEQDRERSREEGPSW